MLEEPPIFIIGHWRTGTTFLHELLMLDERFTPIEELGRMYRQLQFGSLEKIRPRLEAYVRGLDGYRTNQHYISPRQRAEVYRRWHWYMHRFGYHPSAAT